MVVIVLIGILTAAIVPSMRGTLEAELLHAQSRRLIGAIDLAYSRAVTLSQPHRLRLDLKNQRFFIEGLTQSPDGNTEFAAIPYTPGAEGDLDPRITVRLVPGNAFKQIESPPQPFNLDETTRTPPLNGPPTFYPDGTADSATIVLEDRQGFRRALRINPITARVQVRELPRL
jgi:Tfp pilus assembly protein FimT